MDDLEAKNIAIFRKIAGQESETFVERDLTYFSTGRKVMVCERNFKGWRARPPTLELNRPKSPFAKFLKWTNREVYREFQIKRFFIKHRIECALIHFLDYAVDVAPILDKIGIPYVVIAHGYDASSKLRDPDFRDKLKQLKTARGIVCVSEALKRNLEQNGFEHTNTIVRTSSIPIEDNTESDNIRSRNTLLAVGRFVEKKSPLFIVSMMDRLRNVRPDAKLFYIGDGPLFEAAIELTRCLGLQRHVIFLGSRDNKFVMEMTRACGLLVQHSATSKSGDMEGFPAIMQEALSQGLPVVSTRHSGIPEHIIDGYTGFCSEEYDIESFTSNIIKILNLSGEDYHSISENCKNRANELFSYSERSRIIRTMLSENEEYAQNP